uniref:Uncharacterized protein n=1 Tax=Raoultella ornithinolytica TaxID=54291 RepID=A0A7U1HQ54_RAOOR|nr:hypothetical protein [Raoultella ornithinolytica]
MTRRIFPLRRESLSIVQYLIKSRNNYKKLNCMTIIPFRKESHIKNPKLFGFLIS